MHGKTSIVIVLHALRQKQVKEGERAQVINLYTSNIEVEKVKKQIEKKLTHAFLDQYINKPAIDLIKLKLLVELIKQTNLSHVRKEEYIVGTMLIQIALDMHEQVPITSEPTESNIEKTTRQLTVLAGDYYSSLYYLTLAHLEDIELVRTFALAVKEINELKMKRYYKQVGSFEEFIELEQKIESILFIHLAQFFNLSSSSMNTIIEQIMIINKLSNEKMNYHNKQETPLLAKWLSKTTSTTGQIIFEKIDKIIQEKLTVIQDALPYIPSNLQERWRGILDDLISLNKI